MKKFFRLLLTVIILSPLILAEILEVPSQYSTIQSAINAANTGDTVVVAPGTYFENINFRGKNIFVTSHFVLNNDYSFITNTIINGSTPVDPDTASCILIISGEDSTAVLQGFTITGGTGTAWPDEHSAGTFVEGGGIMVALSSPTIKNNIIVNNEAIRRPSGITSSGGGGIRCGDGNPKILNNIIMNNSGMYGGGIVMNFCTGEIKNNLIINNKVFQAVSGAPTFGGGGIWINGSSTTTVIQNNTIMGNSSSGSGSQAAGRGGGILVWVMSVDARNNIVWNNTQTTGNQIQTIGATVVFEYNDIEGGFTGTGNINNDPLIDTLTYMLSNLSPCVDTGDSNSVYDDPEDPGNPGLAEFPSLGAKRNDMGVFGGPNRSLLPDIPTDVNEFSTGYLEKDFKLYQNYPNPFNPSTKIKYEIPLLGGVRGGLVTLKVYDILGREVATLVNEEKPAGNYEVEFDASNLSADRQGLSSGVYFYQLTARDFIETKKLVLLK